MTCSSCPRFSNVLPRDTSLKSQLTRKISLNMPLVSAAMDTVTEGRLAIAMAQMGGVGIIHKNLTAAEQAREVAQGEALRIGRRARSDHRSAANEVRDVIAPHATAWHFRISRSSKARN